MDELYHIPQSNHPRRNRKTFPPSRPGYKYCLDCDQEKSLNDFHKKARSTDGVTSYCKECKNKQDRESYATTPEEQRREVKHQRYLSNQTNQITFTKNYLAKHPGKQAGYQHKYRANNPDVYRNHSRNRRAIIRGGTSQEMIDYQAILERDGMWCYICQKDIIPHHDLAFDHQIPLRPRKGEPQGTHTADNVHPAHAVCNMRKSNKRLEDMSPFDRRGVE